MPHTVRLTGCASNPATSMVKVWKVGAVKHGRKAVSTRVSAPGRVGTRSIGGTLFRIRRSRYGTADAPPTSPQDPRDAPSPGHHPRHVLGCHRLAGHTGLPLNVPKSRKTENAEYSGGNPGGGPQPSRIERMLARL